MKIKKISGLLSPLGKIFNIKNDSKEDTYSCNYINNIVSVSSSEPIGDNKPKIWIKYSGNIVDKSLAIDNRYVNYVNENEQEEIVSNANYWSTGKLKVSPNTKYYFNQKINYTVYYNKAGRAISVTYDSNTFTTWDNIYFVQLSFAKSRIPFNSDIMISTKENADYEPYVEQSININNYGIYDELNLLQEEYYSTEEIKIGTWINGKPIYRQVLTSTSKSTSQSFSLQNAENFINVYGSIYRTDNISNMIPRVRTDDWKIEVADCNSSSVRLVLGAGIANVVSKINLIVEYTKTTD